MFDKLLQTNRDSSISCIFLGVMITIIMVFAGQAYLFGVYFSTIAIASFDAIIKKKYYKKHIIIVALQTLGIIFYCLTLDKNNLLSGSMPVNLSFVEKIGRFVCGIPIMLSSPIIHISFSEKTLLANYLIGILIFLLSIIYLIVFVKNKFYIKSYFPVLCVLYAFSNVAVIIVGRGFSFGLLSLASSRYVVETTLGYLGLIIISMMIISEEKKAIFKVISGLFIVGFILLFIICNRKEFSIGPYRKAYGESMKNIAVYLNDSSDEQLNIFQAPPKDVREGIETMKKYQLSIWSDNEYIEIFFGKEKNNTNQYIISGISNPEDGYSWTDSEEVVLEYSLSKTPVIVHTIIDLQDIYNNNQRVIIEVNSDVVYDNIICNENSIEFDYCLTQEKAKMKIYLPDAQKKDLEETRKLGLAISKIKIFADEY